MQHNEESYQYRELSTKLEQKYEHFLYQKISEMSILTSLNYKTINNNVLTSARKNADNFFPY